MKTILLTLFLLASCDVGQAPDSFFSPPVLLPLAGKASNVALGDLNKDGRLDLIVASSEARTITVILGRHAALPFRAASAQTITLPESPGELAIGDVNSDGWPDLAVDNHDSYKITLLLGDAKGGLVIAPSSPITMKDGQHPHTHGLALGDLNGDGKLDLASINNEDNDISVAFGDGKGGFTRAPRSPFAVGPSPYPLTLADVNNDGRLDMIANATATGPRRATQLARSRALTLLLNDGQGGFKANEIPLRTGEPWSAAVGDLNGDGKPDIVVTHHDQDELTVLLGDGGGGFQEVADSPFNLGRNGWRLELADVNGDRRLDVLVAAGNRVQILLGDGTGKFKSSNQASLLTGGGTWRLALGDLNGDGKPDLIAGNSEGQNVSIFLNR